jgi:hypothetical protein
MDQTIPIIAFCKCSCMLLILFTLIFSASSDAEEDEWIMVCSLRVGAQESTAVALHIMAGDQLKLKVCLDALNCAGLHEYSCVHVKASRMLVFMCYALQSYVACFCVHAKCTSIFSLLLGMNPACFFPHAIEQLRHALKSRIHACDACIRDKSVWSYLMIIQHKPCKQPAAFSSIMSKKQIMLHPQCAHTLRHIFINQRH